MATRRSTSCGVALRGNHLIKHWSSTQRAVTLSSAEAELYGLVKGTTEALGIQSWGLDLGLCMKVACVPTRPRQLASAEEAALDVFDIWLSASYGSKKDYDAAISPFSRYRVTKIQPTYSPNVSAVSSWIAT